MTSDLASRPQPCAAAPAPRFGERARLHWLVPVLPAMTALLLGLWDTGVPSLWTDELVTVDVARRPAWQIWALLGHIDAVHGLYYFLMHAVVEVFGSSPGMVRLPSVLGAAVAAGALAVLGRMLSGAAAGLLAGLAYALAPVVSQYALEARSYTLVTTAAVIATLLLVQALRHGEARWFAAYGAAVVALGGLHLFAVLLVGAHLVTVLAGRYRRGVMLGWLATVAAAGLVLVPLAAVASSQQGAVEWIPAPDAAHLWRSAVGATGTAAATVLALGIGIAGLAVARTGELARVAVPWLVVPPALLLALSWAEPMFVARYVLFCVPAAALLIGAGLTARPRPVLIPAGLTLLTLTLLAQPALRRPDSKWHDITPIMAALDERARAGDAFLVAPSSTRNVTAAYPDLFHPLNDLALGVPGARRAALHAREVPGRELVRRMDGVDRVWVIRRLNGNRRVATLTRERVALLRREGLNVRAGRWTAKNMRLTLYVRDSARR